MKNFKKYFLFSILFLLLYGLAAERNFSQSESADVPDGWKTLAETSDYRQTPRYKEVIEFSKRLAQSSEEIEYVSFGKSREGRDLPLLIASRSHQFEPKRARLSGKPIIFIQAAIHAGESDGKDAGFALLRDIAITKTRKSLIDNAIILFVPIYNVDGHEIFGRFNRINQNGPDEMGFRANSANQNLNRDYMKADNPETIAWLKLWNEWQPDMFIDCHVTDGADFRYNVTYEFARHGEISSGLSNWMDEYFVKNTIPLIESAGNFVAPYIQLADPSDPAKGMYSFIATPRFATGYTALRNRNGLLIETHSVKPYKSRVRGTYDTLRYFIETIGKNSQSLKSANRRADEEASDFFGNGIQKFSLPLQLQLNSRSKEFMFKGYDVIVKESPVSGGQMLIFTGEKRDTLIPWFDFADVKKSAIVPKAYIVPVQWIEAIEKLKIHGIKFSRLKEAKTIKVEMYKLTDPKWATVPFEGRLNLSFKKEAFQAEQEFPADSVVIQTNQVNSRVIVNLLEPDAPDSLLFWGFFNAIFEQKEYSESYIMESIAEEMLKKDATLRAEFAEKLKDEAFAKDPRGRLRFIYERSPYVDKRIGVYPVGRIIY